MNTDQHQRPASDRLRAATHESINFQPKPPGWTPPNEHAEPDPDSTLDHLDATQRNVLINGLLEDWDNPIFTELGLCRAHAITLDQLRAVAERPDFQRYLGIIREIRAARRAAIESAAATAAITRLIYITQCDIGSASAMKECRLAIKQILAIINPPPAPNPPPDPESESLPQPDPHEAPSVRAQKGAPNASERAGQSTTSEPPTTPAVAPDARPLAKPDATTSSPTLRAQKEAPNANERAVQAAKSEFPTTPAAPRDARP